MLIAKHVQLLGWLLGYEGTRVIRHHTGLSVCLFVEDYLTGIMEGIRYSLLGSD